MALTETELQLAQGVLRELRNATTSLTDTVTQAGSYGFQIMIKGTMVPW